MERLGPVSFIEQPDRTALYNRSLIFLDEAKRRGIPIAAITCFGRYLNEFCFAYRGRTYIYEGTPLNLWPAGVDLDDKARVKSRLFSAGIPVAPGRSFIRTRPAILYAQALGFPVVVKPVAGSLSQHVTAPVSHLDELPAAIRLARAYQPRFILERYLAGYLYRATVVGRRQVFVCRKERPNVVGDGSSTIRELIGVKNRDPRRGLEGARNTTLHRLPEDDALERELGRQNLILSSIPAAGRTMYLSDKRILTRGCDIIACTAEVHPANRELFLQVAETLEADLVGIDFICRDITTSWRHQVCAVIETNSLPYLDMHQFPSHGAPDRVTEIVWDIVLERLGVRGRR